MKRGIVSSAVRPKALYTQPAPWHGLLIAYRGTRRSLPRYLTERATTRPPMRKRTKGYISLRVMSFTSGRKPLSPALPKKQNDTTATTTTITATVTTTVTTTIRQKHFLPLA